MSEVKSKKEMTSFEAHEAMKLEMSFNEIKHASQKMLKAQLASKNTSKEYKEACAIELKGREELRAAMLKMKAARAAEANEEAPKAEVKSNKGGK